jgi:hypothetical protein
MFNTALHHRRNKAAQYGLAWAVDKNEADRQSA